MPSPNLIEFILLIISSVCCGLTIRMALGFAKQTWAMTYHHTMSYALLPAVTMIITTLIAGNIALSLGMIGALSIVRFRNPVKNPFELVIFFALITIGIGFATNFKLGLTLTAVVILLIILSKKYEDVSKKKGKKIFSLSFEEGSTVCVMEIKSSSSIKELEESENLAQLFLTKNPISYNYRLISNDKSSLNNLKKEIENNKSIESIEIRYVP
jgi:presenilin-like A22 family membrane protease